MTTLIKTHADSAAKFASIWGSTYTPMRDGIRPGFFMVLTNEAEDETASAACTAGQSDAEDV
jgi:hypothetical protein